MPSFAACDYKKEVKFNPNNKAVKKVCSSKGKIQEGGPEMAVMVG